jgi:AraC family transcriptional regulator of arabinose operon
MDSRIRRAIGIMESNVHRDISRDEMQRELNISYSRLRHLFKNETGLPPTKYLKALRMKRAKQFLENTFLNVKQIMLRLGIKDHSHFARDFKKTYGFTPTQYRSQHLQQVAVNEAAAYSPDPANK